MTRCFRIMVISLGVAAALGVMACSSGDDPDDVDPDGKADVFGSDGCPGGEFRGPDDACMSTDDLCEATGGQLVDTGFGSQACMCEFGQNFVAIAGGCVTPDVAGEPCTGSGGTWTDDASDSWYCICDAERFFFSLAGACVGEADLCEYTGGTLMDTGFGSQACMCEFTEHWLPSIGGCVNGTIAELQCTNTGGTWTDDASDSWYCICPPGQFHSANEGNCVGELDLCEQSGGEITGAELGPFCMCDFIEHFLPALGGCVSNEVAGSQCTNTGGTWTDDASDSYYCICSEGQLVSVNDGSCSSKADLCEASGGQIVSDDYCNCGFTSTFVPTDGGCVSNDRAQALCESSGGTWTDDASDAYYCVCPDEMSFNDDQGMCE